MRTRPGVHNQEVAGNLTLFLMFTSQITVGHISYISTTPRSRAPAKPAVSASRAAPRPAALPALILDGLHGGGRGLRIQVAAARNHGPECLIKLIAQRDARRDVELRDRRVA